MYSPTSLYKVANKQTDKDKEIDVEQFAQIVEYISERKTKEARILLRKAISKDMENAEIYNLLGISYEVDGNRIKASKFYRVSYFMDQTFKAAADNLERVCQFKYNSTKNSICYGVDIMEGKK
ncbi:MAG: hypothetical protein RR338_05145 [Clostridia bacterium]